MASSRILFCMCAIGLSMPALAHAQEIDEIPDDLRLWTRPIAAESTTRAFLRIQRSPESGAPVDDEPLVFSGEVLTPREMGPVDVRFALMQDGEALPGTQELRASTEAGAAPFRFRVDAGQLEHGAYTVSIRVDRSLSGTLALAEFQMLALSASRLARELETLRETYRAAAAFETPTDRLRTARLAICAEAMELAAKAENDLPGQRVLIDFVHQTLGTIRRHAGSNEGQGLGDAPMRVGAQLSAPGAALVQRVADYGLDAVVVDLAESKRVVEEDALDAVLGPMFRQADKLGVGVVLRLDAASVSAEDLPGLGFFLSYQRSLVAASILNEPAFFFSGDAVRKRFAKAMEAQYEDRNKLNRVWRKRLFSFEEIDIWPNYARPAYQYDLQLFQRGLGLETVAKTVGHVRNGAPELPLQVTFSSDAFELGETRRSVDRVATARYFDSVGLRVDHQTA